MLLPKEISVKEAPGYVIYDLPTKPGSRIGWCLVAVSAVLCAIAAFEMVAWRGLFPSTQSRWETIILIAIFTAVFLIPPFTIALFFFGVQTLLGSKTSIELDERKLRAIKHIGPWRRTVTIHLSQIDSLLLSPSARSGTVNAELYAQQPPKESVCVAKGFPDTILRALGLHMAERCNAFLTHSSPVENRNLIRFIDPASE